MEMIIFILLLGAFIVTEDFLICNFIRNHIDWGHHLPKGCTETSLSKELMVCIQPIFVLEFLTVFFFITNSYSSGIWCAYIALVLVYLIFGTLYFLLQ